MFILTRTFRNKKITISAVTIETTFFSAPLPIKGLFFFFWNNMIKYTEHIISEQDTTRAQEGEIYTTIIRDIHK